MTSFLRQSDHRQFLHLNTILIGPTTFLSTASVRGSAQSYSFIMASFNLNGENNANFTLKPFIFIMAVAILCQARLIENHLVMSDCSIIIMCVIDNSIDADSIVKIV